MRNAQPLELHVLDLMALFCCCHGARRKHVCVFANPPLVFLPFLFPFSSLPLLFSCVAPQPNKHAHCLCPFCVRPWPFCFVCVCVSCMHHDARWCVSSLSATNMCACQ